MRTADLCRREQSESSEREDTVQYRDKGEETGGLVAFKRTQDDTDTKARQDSYSVVIICSTGENRIEEPNGKAFYSKKSEHCA